MTTEEAIKIIEVARAECEWNAPFDYQEAFEMAIKALKAQPKSCEYAVNALAVEEMLKNLLPERGMWEIKGDEAKTAICEVVRIALKGLWKLPFVKPDSKESSLTQKALDNNLPSAQPEQQWIPCSERLPKEYGNYLISTLGDDEPDIGSIIPGDKRGWSLCDANGFYWANDKKVIVTAWMPLPEPYRE